MTAEVAILNKSSVSLAADSAITISNGDTSYKTFESGDKLFELSLSQPIGIMFYGNGQFYGLPIANIIRDFRSQKKVYLKVEDAALDFLKFLFETAKSAPDEIITGEYHSRLYPILSEITNNVRERLYDVFFEKMREAKEPNIDIDSLRSELFDREILELTESLKDRFDNAFFVGGAEPKSVPVKICREMKDRLNETDTFVTEASFELFREFILLLIQREILSISLMGIVVAGFGEDEKLPSLYACQIDGFFGNRLKYAKSEQCDIHRTGRTAAIYSFAQKDMMDRFLYGFDDETKNSVQQFTKSSIDEIFELILSKIEDDDLRSKLELTTSAAKQAFNKKLQQDCFSAITEAGRREIEDMIRFMPKPELAQMAESLINLTSMKRRVSKGMETVGGPVDVAVISKSEGFVWVKRKHYFPAKLNARYFERLNLNLAEDENNA